MHVFNQDNGMDIYITYDFFLFLYLLHSFHLVRVHIINNNCNIMCCVVSTTKHKRISKSYYVQTRTLQPRLQQKLH